MGEYVKPVIMCCLLVALGFYFKIVEEGQIRETQEKTEEILVESLYSCPVNLRNALEPIIIKDHRDLKDLTIRYAKCLATRACFDNDGPASGNYLKLLEQFKKVENNYKHYYTEVNGSSSPAMKTFTMEEIDAKIADTTYLLRALTDLKGKIESKNQVQASSQSERKEIEEKIRSGILLSPEENSKRKSLHLDGKLFNLMAIRDTELARDQLADHCKKHC